MSLAEKWEEWFNGFDHKEHTSDFWKSRLRRAFYAGAEVAARETDCEEGNAAELLAEINRLKGQKTDAND